MNNISVGSVCSGIEAASVAWSDLSFDFKWFSEIADFPSKVLSSKYPHIPNLGDMCNIPEKLQNKEVVAPDLICGGTPCQAFSLAGWKKGLDDHRGNLTLKFVDVIEENDRVRNNSGQAPTIVFWENVEGVLRDKTNAFGCFLSSLAGFDAEIIVPKWPQAGVIYGVKRNIAWRVLDAKYFGLPQQRRRLYVLAGGKNFFPEKILFERAIKSQNNSDTVSVPLSFVKEGNAIEIFRSYTDCLYSAYGTKWNGNAAAYNGSLFVVQNGRLRRFTPLECERLMGFPDNYTNIPKSTSTARYQSIGNSWAVPVIKWLGSRIVKYNDKAVLGGIEEMDGLPLTDRFYNYENNVIIDVSKALTILGKAEELNFSDKPLEVTHSRLFDIIDINASENFYITPAGCKGILRRKEERGTSINPRLEVVLRNVSSMWSDEKIEKISRKQSRGRFSRNTHDECLYSLFESS